MKNLFYVNIRIAHRQSTANIFEYHQKHKTQSKYLLQRICFFFCIFEGYFQRFKAFKEFFLNKRMINSFILTTKERKKPFHLNSQLQSL